MADTCIKPLSLAWLTAANTHRYSYNFTWLGVPIIQFPQDILAIQEIIWKVRPELIIETGVAHGGSLVLSASILEMTGGGEVVGIDIDIRPENRARIEAHPMFRRIRLVEGSSVDPAVFSRVAAMAQEKASVLVILDSMHTRDHVLRELELYSGLVTAGSYLVVLDTAIEDMPDGFFPDRPWGRGNSPKTAVHEFLRTNRRFAIDYELENRLLVTTAPDGFLKCLK
ncbi:MAG: cephalosporin hydroxylase family protein [Nitrospirae bacterium]|nr:cephalosporin hydroxylase family protein [Nitrospirota bacterium]